MIFDENEDARVHRACAYPFDVPDHGYLLTGGEVQPLVSGETFADEHIDDRFPVIACGSNRAPARLVEKFGGNGEIIPVERARLRDFDVVYSAHITAYGSIPATLAPAPGTIVELSITWLTEAQLTIMHDSELTGENYEYVQLDAVDLALEGSGDWQKRVERVFAYQSLRGPWRHNEGPVALAAVRAESRSFQALCQETVQAVLHRRLGNGESFARFVLDNICDPGLRRERIAVLATEAKPYVNW